MRTSRLLTAALGFLLATTTVALTGTAATAGDNDREDWSGQRALRMAEGESQPVRLLTTQGKNNSWALLARRISNPSATPDIWRLREHSGTSRTGLTWRNPARAPKEVTSFRSAQNRWGQTATSWIHDGGLWAGTKMTRSRAPMAVNRLADQVPSAGAPQLLMPAFGEGFVIEYAGTWHEYNPGPLNSCNGCDSPYQRWYQRAAPAGPAGAPLDYTRVLRHDTSWLMAFWTGDTGNPDDQKLRSAERLPSQDGPVWSEPQVLAEGHKFVAFNATAHGYRLVTLDPSGRINLFDYADTTYGAPGAFTNQRVISGRTDGSMPQVLIDREGVLTLTWRDADQPGMFLWQEDRPRSTYLEQPTLVPGTERSLAATAVTAPYGTLTVTYQPDGRRAPWQTRVVHLPTGTSRWTDPIRLTSPKPAHSRGAYSVGQPRITGDVWIAANDDNGVWVHRFDAPKPGSKITRPARTNQPDRTYTLRWKTTWAHASDYEVRARISKQSGWKDVAVPQGARSKTVTRPRGETRCYQVRGILPSYGMRTDWSKSRCITVRR